MARLATASQLIVPRLPGILGSARFWIGTVVSLVCLWLAIRPVPFAVLAQTLVSAQFAWLLPAIGLQLVAVVARARRWAVLLHGEAALGDAFWALGIGYLFTNVFPFRLGEAARVVVLARGRKLPVVRVAASAVVERMLDVTTILLALALVLPWMSVPQLVLRSGVTLGLVVVIAFVGIVVLARSEELGERVLNVVTRYGKFLPADQVRGRWSELRGGLTAIATPRVAFEAAFWSIVTWALSAGTYWCVLRAFRSDSRWIESVFLLVSLSLASSVPSSPGFIGVFQLVGQQALVLPFGSRYDVATALAITLAANVTYYVVTTALGLVAVLVVGGSVLKLRRGITAAASPVSVPAPDSIA